MASAAAAAKGDVQKQIDEEQSQGFIGDKVDPTPNEHYTVAGVLAGKPTPETDAAAADKARESVRTISARA